MTEKPEKEIRYSYSRLDTYAQCPFRYFLKYIEGHYAKTGSIALEFGTLTHETEEAIGNAIIAGQPIDYDALKENYAKKCFELQQKYPEDFMKPDKTGRTYTEKINGYMNDGIYRLEKFVKENPELELVGCEVKFQFNYYDGHIFRGAIDRVFQNKVNHRYYVQDIKTYGAPLEDGTHDGKKKDEHLITPLQFVVYSLALSDKFGIDPNDVSCAYDLPLCNMTQQAGTKNFITRGCSKLDKIFMSINNKEWAPKQSALCHWCEFCLTNDSAGEDTKFLCPYFMHWTRENPSFEKENDWDGLEHHQEILEGFKYINGIK